MIDKHLMMTDILNFIVDNILLIIIIGGILLIILYDLITASKPSNVRDKSRLQNDRGQKDMAQIRGEEHSKATKSKDSVSQYNQWGG